MLLPTGPLRMPPFIARRSCLAAVLPLAPQWAHATARPNADAPIFVLNSLDADVSVISPKTWTVQQRIATGKEPHHMYLTPDERSLIVANAAGNSLTFVDPRSASVQRTLPGILDPYQLRFSPDMTWLVTAANRLNHIDIYRWDGQQPQLAKRIASSKTPSHIWIDSASRNAFVTMQDSSELVAVDLNNQSLRWRLKVGNTPADVYGTADNKLLLVALTGADAVEAYQNEATGAKLVKRIVTGKGAHAFRAAGDGRHVFVSNRVANTISKVDCAALTVVDEYPAPGGPDCIEALADGRHLLVTSRWARKLTVIDMQARQVVRQVPVGRSPHGVWTLDHAPR